MDKLFFTVMIGSCRCDCVMEVSLVQIHFAYKSWVVCRFQPFIFRGVFVHCISDSLAQIQGKLHQITQETRQVLWECFVWRVEPTSYVKNSIQELKATRNFNVVALKLVTSLFFVLFFHRISMETLWGW